MKKTLLLVAMVFGLSLACLAQSSLRLNLEAVHDYDYTTKQWGPPLAFTKEAYIKYVEGNYFHVHLPELDQDFNANIISKSSDVDTDGDTVYSFIVANTVDGTEPAMIFKIIVPKDTTARKQFYITVPDTLNFGFIVTNAEYLSTGTTGTE